MGEPYSIRVDSHGGMTTISLGGEIDVAAGRSVRAAVADSILVDPRPDRLVIDLTDTTFMDSTGLNALVLARHAARFVGAVLEVTSGPPTVMRVLEISGLQRFLNVRSPPPSLISAR